MTDRELLEAAAKAAGIWVGDDTFADPIDRKYSDALGLWVHVGDLEDVGRWWNPRNNGDHALSLAVKLGLTINPYTDGLFVSRDAGEPVIAERWGDSREATTRLCIVRAAAAMAG